MPTTTMTKVASTNNSDILRPIGLNTLNKLSYLCPIDVSQKNYHLMIDFEPFTKLFYAYHQRT